MHSTVFRFPVTIKETYLDTFGHMNNAVYLTLFEDARWEFLNQNGYGLHEIQKAGLGPAILEANIRYLKELRLRDQIVIETTLLSYEKKIAKMTQKMVRDGVVCCTFDMTFGLFDLKARKLVKPTPEWLTAIGAAQVVT